MPEQLDDLKRRRAMLSARLSSINDARQKLATLDGKVADAQRNLADFDADTQDAMLEWAKAGDGAALPEPDHASRMTLVRILARAQAEVANIGSARETLDNEQRQIAGELQRVSAEIERVALDTLQAEHRIAVDELTRWFVAEVQPRFGKILGLRAFLTELAQRHQATGPGDAAMALFQRGEAIGEVRPDAEPNPTQAEVLFAAGVWRKRLSELTDGPPAADASGPNIISFGAVA